MAVDYAALKAGGFMRQKQKDTFSLRLKVVGGTVTADQLAAVQDVANKYGHGYVHLTARQGIEIPFIQLKDIDAVKADLAKGGVVPGVCGPRVRTVTACQGGRCCPSGCIDALDIAEKLDKRYFGRELNHKFKFGVTGCRNNCLKTEENDFGVKGGYDVKWKEDACIGCGVCVKACREGAITQDEDGKIHVDYAKCNNCGRCVKSCPADAWDYTPGFIVTFGGTFGNNMRFGEEAVPFIRDEDTLFRVADATIDFFAENGLPSERFFKTLERVGWDKFKVVVNDAYNGKTKKKGDETDG
ncbi:MAG: 4Fe-4S binding protein [Lachnospiraceae bacterium]|nr:4Fe-4S binding protein [Lachnospiraceae bacterium]MDD7326479.1 4Fe-4S binding protein [Lachnospiraceae bacterium]MDY2759257.1 4Fe-4S binding protein [Lachnospiraceae bacterium]